MSKQAQQTIAINHSPDLISDSGDNNCLFKAIKNHDIAKVEALIFAGANISSKNKNGDDAIVYALETGNLKILKYLVSKITKKEYSNNSTREQEAMRYNE